MGRDNPVGTADNMATYRRMLVYLRPYWKKLVIAMVLMIIVSAASGGIAFMVKPVMDDIFIAKNITMLHLLPFVIISIFFIRSLADYGRYYLMADVGQRIIMDIRDELYAHVQNLSMPFFACTPTGIVISRITNDVSLVQASVTSAVTGLAREACTMVGLLVVVFYRDWQMALMAMVVFPVVAYPINIFGKRLKHYSTKGMKVMGDIMSILDESISNIRIVKAYNMEEYEKKRFGTENRRYFRNWMRRLSIRAVSTPLMQFIGGISTAFILWYGGMKVIDGTSTPGNFFSFMTALFMLYAPIRKFNELNIVVQEGIAAATRIFDMMDTRIEITDSPGAVELVETQGDLKYRDVCFRYGDDKYAVEDISFHVESGQQVALVGESGAGKTTIVNLLPRLFDATQGEILVDQRNIRGFTISSLRDKIAIVSQEMVLFDDSIAANIAYGLKHASTEDIIRAAKRANAHGFIMEKPDGYDTRVGEAGTRLSGGQKQRICIARAIIKDAPILILDEATSSLDTKAEREVHKAMDSLMANRTTLIIAHRLSTIVNADKIIVLKQGRIVEQGAHRDLLELDGHYASLYRLQFGK